MSDTPMNKPSETDWARVDAMTDDEIDTSDISPLTDDFFKRAKVRMPKRKVAVTAQVLARHGQSQEQVEAILREIRRKL